MKIPKRWSRSRQSSPRLSGTLLKEQEADAVKITKIIQEFIAAKAKYDSSQNTAAANYSQFFAPFYNMLEEKVDSLKRIDAYKEHLSNRESLETDLKGTLVKKISMEYSTSYFAEIVAHVMMIMDINFLQSEELFKKVKKLFIQLIDNFSKLQLDTLKDAILEEYYNDLVFSMVD